MELVLRPLPGGDDSFGALVRLFTSEANPKWKGYEESTRKTWKRELDLMASPKTLGAKSRSEIRPALVQCFFDALADRPGKQEAGLYALKALEKWAIVREYLPRQITLGVEIGSSDAGHIPWTEDQVRLAETHAKPAIAQAVTLAANTGQRGSDLVKMGWRDLETYDGINGINVVQKKTKRRVWIPITPELATAMEGWERRPGPFLMHKQGKPWTRSGLTNAWRYERDNNRALAPLRLENMALDEGVDPGADDGLVLHGLRGFACVRLRRLGATESQIADMVGMSIQMVVNYCKFSSQRDSAVAAVLHLKNAPRRAKSNR